MWRIIPNTRHSHSRNLAKDLHRYRSFVYRLTSREGTQRIVWEIHIRDDDVFYVFDGCDIDVIRKHFPTCTIEEGNYPIADIPSMQLHLENHFFLSLKIDHRQAEPITSILEAQRMLSANENAVVQYILTPESLDWHHPCTQAYKQFKKGKMPGVLKLDAGYVAKEIAKLGACVGLEIANTIQELILDDGVEPLKFEDEDVARILRDKPLSRATMSKANHDAYNVSIRVASDNPQVIRALESSFNALEGDNRLIARRSNTSKLRARVPYPNHNVLSTEETDALLMISCSGKMVAVDRREVSVSDIIQTGKIPIGTATKNGQRIECMWPNYYDYITLPKVIVGRMGGGKSTYIKRFAVEAHKQGHGVIVLDYIKQCEVAESIKPHVSKDSLVELDLSDLSAGHGLDFPELGSPSDKWARIKAANDFSESVCYLVNALNDGKLNPLTPKMHRTLDAACYIAYLAGVSSLEAVVDMLSDADKRRGYIDGLNDHRAETLRGLDEITRSGEVITKETKIEGIIDRVNVLMRNVYLENMLTNNDAGNFVEWMNEGKTVLIKMPQSEFKNSWVKDTLATYYLSRIWLATLIRGRQAKPKVCHVITDEIHQLDNAAQVIAEHITESRKFGVSYLFSCQYLRQFRELLEGVQGAGANYMLLAGTEKSNFVALEEECGEFELEELLRMDEYHSFNVVQTPTGLQRFISKLPKPI